MSWDAFQLRALHALGFDPMLPVGQRPTASTGVAAPDDAGPDAPLRRAVQRAADGGDLPGNIDWQALGRDPAAKKRLWPVLRALRRRPA